MKVGLLISKGIKDYKKKSLELLVNEKKISVEIAIIDNRKTLTVKEKILKNIKRGRGGYILVMIFQKLFKVRQKEIDSESYLKMHNIKVYKTANIHDVNSLGYIRGYDLDLLILLNGFGILRKQVLNITRLGVLSYHHGDMRKYRGMPPCFWELYNNEKEIGITVQRINEKLDAGFPIVEKSIKIDKKFSYDELLSKVQKESIGMMHYTASI